MSFQIPIYSITHTPIRDPMICQDDHIVKTYYRNKTADLVILDNGMVFTAYHPIFYYGRWVYSNDIDQSNRVSFVLERDHRMLINDTPCICSGTVLLMILYWNRIHKQLLKSLSIWMG